MTTRARPTVLLETRSGYPYRYRRYASRQGAMRAAGNAQPRFQGVHILGLFQRVRILALPGDEGFTWLKPYEPTPVGSRMVAHFDGAGWVRS